MMGPERGMSHRPWAAPGGLEMEQREVNGRPRWVAHDAYGVAALAASHDDLVRLLSSTSQIGRDLTVLSGLQVRTLSQARTGMESRVEGLAWSESSSLTITKSCGAA